jgi:predicted nucleotidyltransferase/DNA-binding XRE family transcriptional regulator
MSLLGKHIRKLRKQHNLTLQQLAEALEMDAGLLSKIERGHRQATKAMAEKLANYLKVDSRDLIVEHLSDKILYAVEKEELAPEALKAAEEQLIYNNSVNYTPHKIIDELRSYFKMDNRIYKAWLFGSFARGDYRTSSDVDVMVEFKKDKRITLFDLAEIKQALQNQTGLEVDLVEKGAVKEHAVGNVEKDLQLIYNSGSNEG